MRRRLAMLTAAGVLATGLVVGTQTAAFAATWQYEGSYPNATSCEYAGQNMARVRGWLDWFCDEQTYATYLFALEP